MDRLLKNSQEISATIGDRHLIPIDVSLIADLHNMAMNGKAMNIKVPYI